jgi:pyrroline-5-carboxylate reductase
VIQEVDVIVLAIPPKEHESMLNQMKRFVSNQFIVTVAAGIGPSFLEERLSTNVAVGWIYLFVEALIDITEKFGVSKEIL